jgi:tRNA threonylcarbamoyladenosine biosynthesis protein TsaE
MSLELSLADSSATDRLGAALAPHIRPGMVIFLSGELGAGKTSLVRALLRALGETGPVKSPTYALVELYAVSRLNLYHFDFYRFNESSDWADAGFRDHFDGSNVCLVEWPEKAAGQLPPWDLWIRLSLQGSGRLAHLAAGSVTGEACLSALKDFSVAQAG